MFHTPFVQSGPLQFNKGKRKGRTVGKRKDVLTPVNDAFNQKNRGRELHPQSAEADALTATSGTLHSSYLVYDVTRFFFSWQPGWTGFSVAVDRSAQQSRLRRQEVLLSCEDRGVDKISAFLNDLTSKIPTRHGA